MTPNIPASNNQSSQKLSLTPTGKEVPSALSMMVDSMASMVQRAKQDLERVDQRAKQDLERVDQRARKDVKLLDQRARKDVKLLDQRAKADRERMRRD